MEAVKQNGNAIWYVYEKDIDLCMVAVNQNGNALKYIDSSLQTFDVCMQAIKQNQNAMDYVKSDLMKKIIHRLLKIS